MNHAESEFYKPLKKRQKHCFIKNAYGNLAYDAYYMPNLFYQKGNS